MTAHTPGPWRVVIDGTCSGAWPFIGPAELTDGELVDDPVAELGTTHIERVRTRLRGMPGTFAEKPQRFESTPEHDTIMANARLIAAAPDLLAALEWMVAHDDTNEGNEPVESLGGQTWSEYNAYWLAGLEQARAAIAKAKGEQP